jgi:hypothetical protein
VAVQGPDLFSGADHGVEFLILKSRAPPGVDAINSGHYRQIISAKYLAVLTGSNCLLLCLSLISIVCDGLLFLWKLT